MDYHTVYVLPLNRYEKLALNVNFGNSFKKVIFLQFKLYASSASKWCSYKYIHIIYILQLYTYSFGNGL